MRNKCLYIGVTMSNIKLLMNKALFACIFVLSFSLTSQAIEEVVVTATKKLKTTKQKMFRA